MPSITTWSRIEPQTSGPTGVDVGYAARVHDPLWLLARQWQVGEFQGEDGGTPIVARWRARVAPMTRFVAGPIPIEHPARRGAVRRLNAVPARDPGRAAATATVGDRAGSTGCGSRSRDGQHFLRLLGSQQTTERLHDGVRHRRTPCRR